MAVDLARQIVARWDDQHARHIPLLREAAIQAVIVTAADPGFAQACHNAGIAVMTASELQFTGLPELESADPAKPWVLSSGLWPGVTRPANVDGRGDETASASREPWVDANGYWIDYLQALYPNQPAVLGYLPRLGDRAAPYDSLELALIEARAGGGNYILALEPRYREALLRNDEKARTAWRQLGRTARWMQENASLFDQPALPIVTALVESTQATAEILNLLYRRGASPAVRRADDPPQPDPQRRRVIVAASLRPPREEIRGRILEHAARGASVIVDGDWWRNQQARPLRQEPDRDFYVLGEGKIVAHHKKILDPSEFALDVIDIVTHPKRAVRVWNAPALIVLATASGSQAQLICVNYGSPIDLDVQARIQGHYAKATLFRPEAEPRPLKAARRGSTTEVMIPELSRLGIVVFG